MSGGWKGELWRFDLQNKQHHSNSNPHQLSYIVHSRFIVVICCPLVSHWYGGSCKPCSFLQHTNDPWWVAPSWTKTRGKPSKSGQEFPWQRSVDVYPPFPSPTCSRRLQTNNLEKNVTPSVSTNQTQPDPTPSTTLKTVEDPPHLDVTASKNGEGHPNSTVAAW